MDKCYSRYRYALKYLFNFALNMYQHAENVSVNLSFKFQIYFRAKYEVWCNRMQYAISLSCQISFQYYGISRKNLRSYRILSPAGNGKLPNNWSVYWYLTINHSNFKPPLLVTELTEILTVWRYQRPLQPPL